MRSSKSAKAAATFTSVAALALALSACSDTMTAPEGRLSPRGPNLTTIATPSSILSLGNGGSFNSYTADQSGRGTSEFWDNVSSDNAAGQRCNVGFYASAAIGTACLNEALPLGSSDANATTVYPYSWGDNDGTAGPGNNPSAFMFSGATAYNVTLIGSYAGAGSPIGWFTKIGGVYQFNLIPQWTGKQVNFNVTVPAGADWGFFINTLTPQTNGCGGAAHPNYACSDATGGFAAAPNQHFALFTNSTASQFLVGAEDNILLLLGDTPNPTLHDSDYNDYIFSVVPVPVVQICDFITFGRLVTTTAGGDKVVISGNAGGNAPDGGILGEIEISIGGTDYHVHTIDTYGPTTSGVLFPDQYARVITGMSGTHSVELRLRDDPNPGQGEPGTAEGDKVWLKIDGIVIVGLQTLDQGNIQLHLNCRGPND